MTSQTIHAGSQRYGTRIILTGLIAAVSMSSIDQTIVSLSAQEIQAGLGITASAITWVINAYLIAAAALFPLAGRLADMVGYKRMMLLGVLGFAGGSLLCTLAPSDSLAFAWMVLSRIVQGVGLAFLGWKSPVQYRKDLGLAI